MESIPLGQRQPPVVAHFLSPCHLEGQCDGNRKTCRDVARSKVLIKAIHGICVVGNCQTICLILKIDSRSLLTAISVAAFTSLLPPLNSFSPVLLNLCNHTHLSYPDEDSGLSLLHEAARRGGS